jgi:predicted RNase H-like nuclease (RuvC/YqgF family)
MIYHEDNIMPAQNKIEQLQEEITRLKSLLSEKDVIINRLYSRIGELTDKIKTYRGC